MPYTREHMEAGEVSIALRADTPRDVLRQVAIEDYAFATIVVTPTWIDTNEAADAFLLTASDSGMAAVLLEQQGDRRVLVGDGLLAWLGDEGDGGDMYVSADTTSTADLYLQLALLVFSNGLTVDAPYSADRTLKVSAGTTPRQFLDMIRGLYPGGPYEYRVDAPDEFGVINVRVDRRGVMYPTTDQPTVVLAADGGSGASTGTLKYLVLDGTGDYASAPDNAALDITGDLDVRARVRCTDYTTGTTQTAVAKWNAFGVNQRSYRFGVDGTGEVIFGWSTTGADSFSASSTGASLTDGTDYWIRATIDVNDGGGNRVIRFYKSTDTTTNHEDVTWTLISTTTTAGTTSIYASTAVATIGRIVSASPLEAAGRVYAAAILSGISDGTVVADPIFSSWSPGTTSQADAAGRTWTLAGNAYIAGDDSAPIIGLPCDLELPAVDVRDWRSEIVAGDANTAIVGSATNTPPDTWANLAGDPPVMRSYVHSSPRTRFVDRPRRWGARIGANKYAAWVLNSAAQATKTATTIANQVNSHAFTVSAEVDAEAIGRHIACGDTVYVWDLDLGLVDTDNQIEYRGEPAHPVKLQVQRMEVPITEGMGVYLRTWNGSAFGYVDLTRWVEWEEGPASLELGTRTWLTDRRGTRPKRLNRLRIRARARRDYLIGRYVAAQN